MAGAEAEGRRAVKRGLEVFDRLELGAYRGGDAVLGLATDSRFEFQIQLSPVLALAPGAAGIVGIEPDVREDPVHPVDRTDAFLDRGAAVGVLFRAEDASDSEFLDKLIPDRPAFIEDETGGHTA